VTLRLQDALVITSTGLCVTASEAVSISSNAAQDVGAVEQGLGKLGSAHSGDGGGVVHSGSELDIGVGCSKR
jgi:hypothetical protein